MIITEPICRAFRIIATIEAYPYAFKVITIIPFFAVIIEDTFFASTCFLAAIGRCICAIPIISAPHLAVVYITIFVLWA